MEFWLLCIYLNDDGVESLFNCFKVYKVSFGVVVLGLGGCGRSCMWLRRKCEMLGVIVGWKKDVDNGE